MALIQDVGVTLRRLDFAEHSQVMVFFAREHGQVRAIAKGIKRSTKTRFATGIDLLEVGDMVLSVRQPRQEALAILTEWKPRRALAGLREKLARLYAGQYAAEITAALTADWDPHPSLYDGLLSALDQLCGAEAVLGPIVAYQRVLLRQIGSWPEFEVCVACRRPPTTHGELWFSSFEGGLLCRDCEAGFAEKRLVDQRALSLIREPTGSGCPAFSWEAAFDVLNYHLAHLMGREPLLAPKLAPLGPHAPARLPEMGDPEGPTRD
ncbi:MAG: DNA repair protein RecO [Planctomycetota bacterium]